MDESRFFRIFNLDAYEASRLALDAAWRLPPGETIYAPLAKAPRAKNGDVMLGIRAMHCELPDVASALSEMIENGWGAEVTATQYWDALSQPNEPLRVDGPSAA